MATRKKRQQIFFPLLFFLVLLLDPGWMKIRIRDPDIPDPLYWSAISLWVSNSYDNKSTKSDIYSKYNRSLFKKNPSKIILQISYKNKDKNIIIARLFVEKIVPRISWHCLFKTTVLMLMQTKFHKILEGQWKSKICL